MYKIKFSLFALLTILLLSAAGCKKEDSNPVTPENEISNSLTNQPTPNFGTAYTDYNGLCATIRFDMQAPIPGIPAVETNVAIASLGNQGGIDAGAVAVNSNTLGKLAASGKTTYMFPDINNPTASLSNVFFNGSNHNWSVAGGNGIPAFSGSVKSVSTFNLTSPVNAASVQKSNDLQVQWGGGTTNKVLVQITSTSSGNTKVYQELADNGSFKIPAADLASLTGNSILYVVKYNYSFVMSGGKRYVLLSEIVKSGTIPIN